VEQDPGKNAEMLARLNATTGRDTTKTSPPGNAQDKYISATTPTIHNEHPLGLLEGISPEQIEAWLVIKTGKILACPLRDRVHHKVNHKKIAMELMATAKEITGFTNIQYLW
jgi:hypothetical protein